MFAVKGSIEPSALMKMVPLAFTLGTFTATYVTLKNTVIRTNEKLILLYTSFPCFTV